jgi:aspartyl-tRNA(Asn)/glutamyl-tRNA(Gln) amidotransferase subunit A
MNNEAIRALTLIEVSQAIASGELTSETVTAAAIEQAEHFKDEYALFITFTPEQAMEEAQAADRARAAGKLLGPLHGVPITIKDNIDTAGILTTAGAKVLKDRIPAEDATVVKKLKQAGAISLGKTNMHEMAYGGTSTNPHYGAVRNPWSPERIPGGSSGGAAACLALQIGYAALGTDAGGSVRMPASLCGQVGLKQTHGLVSLSGCVPTGSWSIDHIGPHTKTVADSALMLSLMQSYDPTDPDSALCQPEAYPVLASLNGLTVGIPENHFWENLDPQVESLCYQSVMKMQEAGAKLVSIKLETLALLAKAQVASLAESYVFHEPYITAHPEDYGEDIRYRILAGRYILATDYVRATRVRRLFIEEMSRTLDMVDVIAAPTLPIPAPPIGADSVTVKDQEFSISGANSWFLARNTSPANQAGVPAISIPAGLTGDGLPVGLQLMAGAFQDQKLLAIAAVVERLNAFDITPPILKMTEVA